MPDASAIRKAVREAIVEIVGRPVRDSEAIVSSGVIDSLSVLRLIGRLEVALGSRLPAEALQPEDFDSVDATIETLGRIKPEWA